MKNYHSDFSSQPKFIRYYGLNDFPEAHFLIEAECFDKSVDTMKETKSSARGIIFGLGMIITLVVLSVFQLYLALEVIKPHPEITKSKELSTKAIPERKFNNSQGVANLKYETKE